MIVLIRVILLIIWFSLEAPHVVDMERSVTHTVPPFVLVTEECQANHFEVWLTVNSIYTAILMITMILLAVLTRKIKRNDYKDSKKITIFVASFSVCTFVFVSLWIFFRNIDAVILSRFTYGLGTATGAFLCQVFLVSPKIVPLVLQSCKLRSNTREH